MTHKNVTIKKVEGRKGRHAFVDLGRAFAARLEHSVPQLRHEQLELIDPAKNPFFGHARVALFIAYRAGKPVGRISASIDEMALSMPKAQGFGPETGNFGYFDAEDEGIARALLDEAEAWLKAEGMTRALGPISMSVWEEPGLLVKGQDHAPMVMMGHHPLQYREWIENAGYVWAKSLFTYDLDITREFPRIVQRIVQSGERNERIRVRQADKSRWNEEVQNVVHILHDAWSGNWGFVPYTDDEVAYMAKKLHPIIFEPLNMFAELDGEPVAFMLTFPDVNHVLSRIDGKLFPFGWFHLLRWLKSPRHSGMRVPLMGVKRELHNSRLASQLAFMMISEIRKAATSEFLATRGEIGWILDDNKGMIAIADAIESKINREYQIFAKPL